MPFGLYQSLILTGLGLVIMVLTGLGLVLGDVLGVYQREFLALRQRLHSAEEENLRRSKELNLVLDEIKRAIAEKQALRDNRTWAGLSGKPRQDQE